MKKKLLFLVFALLFSQSFAQLSLVKDINASTTAKGNIFNLAVSHNTLYFIMDGDLGYELWRSDGGIFSLVKDIRPGRNSSYPSQAVVIDDILFFTADDGVHGNELWKSDGTQAGTVLVKDIKASGSSNLGDLINVNGNLYFTAEDATNGRELWTSDGTEKGTVIAMDINPGIDSSDPMYLTNVNGTLFFNATNGVQGNELWKSDGGVISLVKDIIDGVSSSYPDHLTAVGNILFFIVTDESSGIELWKSEGTLAGTHKVADMFLGQNSTYPYGLTNVNGTLFFVADSPLGVELWKSDGTTTVLVKDIWKGQGSSVPDQLINVNGVLFFSAENGNNGRELWKSDGSDGGTVMVTDIESGPDGSFPNNLKVLDDGLYFSSQTSENGTELWRTDGTVNGTQLILDIQQGGDSSYPGNLMTVDHDIYFRAYTGTDYVKQLWKTDGTSAGTMIVDNVPTGTGDAFVSEITEVNGSLLFESNFRLWATDGTEGGTNLVKDFNFWPSSLAHPTEFTHSNGVLFFTAETRAGGMELWKSNGTESGTTLVKDIWPGGIPNGAGYSSYPNELVDVNGIIYFTAEDGKYGRELWRSDGSEGGTFMVKDIHAGVESSNPYNLTDINGVLYFAAHDGKNGEELWKSDAFGTVLVKDICSGCSSYPSKFTEAGNTIFFSANTDKGFELWKTDGTIGGTTMVKDINTVSGTNPSNLTSFKGKLFFTAFTGVDKELWMSDGTESGTVVVRDAANGYSPGSPALFTMVNNVLFFTATDAVNGWELWKTDGTALGTVLVKDINTEGSSDPSGLININGVLFFTANNATGLSGLWRSDGTTEGTWMVSDDVLVQSELVLFNNEIFFTGNTFSTGSELWKYKFGPDLRAELSGAYVPSGSTVYIQNTEAFSEGEPLTIKLKNVGSSDLKNLVVSIVGNCPLDYSVNTSGMPVLIAPGTDTEFFVTFSPKATGLRDAKIQIASNANDDGPYEIRLIGAANKIDQTISFPEMSERNFTEGDFTLNATSTSNNPIIFSSSDESIAKVINGKVSIFTVGTVILTASQPGNNDYFAAAEISRLLKINKGHQLITFGELGSRIRTGPDFDLSGSTSSGLAVSYVSSDASIASINGKTVTIVGAGTAIITASQVGNENYSPAADVQRVLVITESQAEQSIIFDAIAEKTFGASAFDLNAIASSGLEVYFSSSDTDVISIDGKTITILKAGSATITAHQAGNENYLAAPDAVQSLVINKAPQIITFLDLDAKTFGDPTFDLSATTSTGMDVLFSSSDISVASVYGKTVTILKAGEVTITASQAGNENYSVATEVQQILRIDKRAQTITFGPLSPMFFGETDFELSATSSSGLDVSYTSSDINVASISGKLLTIVKPGVATITANQSGDGNYVSASEVQQALLIDKASQIVNFESLPSKMIDSLPFDLNANATSGLAVTFTSSNPSIATVDGKTITILGTGTTSITASQSGNSYYLASADVAQLFTVTKKKQIITFGVLPEKILEDASFAVAATSTSNLPILFSSSNTQVATVNGNTVTLVGAGETEITASNPGDFRYDEAPSVIQVLTVELITTNEEYDFVEETSVYPNPTDDNIVIENRYLIGNVSYNIINAKAEIVMRGSIDSSANGELYLLNVSDLAAGIYVLKIFTSNNTIVKRIVKR